MMWFKRKPHRGDFIRPEFPLERLATDENVKALFDHCRNLLVMGAMIAVGDWYYDHAPSGGWAMYFRNFLAVSLVLLVGFMFLLNQAHGMHKLHRAGWSARTVMFFGFFYNALAMAVIITAARSR